MSSDAAAARLVVPVLVVAWLAISSSAVLVRLAGPVDPWTLAAIRTGLAGVIALPFARRFAVGELPRIALAGAALGLHFGLWFTSLAHTSVARSTVLVCLAPLWVVVIDALVGREPPGTRIWVGAGFALGGIGLIAGAAPDAGGGWLGDGAALLGGLCAAAYLTLGRVARQQVGIGAYAATVSLVASLTLGLAIVLADPGSSTSPAIPLGAWSSPNWAAALGLAVGPQLFGHNGMNYALRFWPAARVSMVSFLEPVGAAVLAWIVLAETPSGAEAIGGTVVVAGVMTALWQRQPKPGSAPPPTDPNRPKSGRASAQRGPPRAHGADR